MTRLNLFNFTWGVGLVLTPLVVRISERLALRASKDVFFYLIFILMGIFSIKVKEIDKKVLFCIVFTILQAFLVTTDFTMYLFMYQLQMFLAGIGIFYLICTNEIKQDFILNCICLTGILQSIWCILQYFHIQVMPYVVSFVIFWQKIAFIDSAPLDLGGSMGNSNISGALMALSIPAFFRKKWVFWAILPATGVYLSGSSMAFATLIGSFLYYGYDRYFNKKFLPFIGFFITAALFIIYGDQLGGFLSGSNRYEVWDKAIMLINKYGLYLGNGLGHFGHFFSQYFQPGGYRFMQIHNEYLEVFYAFGIVGSVVFLYMIYKSIASTKDRILLCGIFASCVNCFGNFTMHISATAFIVLSYFAMAINGEKDVSIVEW